MVSENDIKEIVKKVLEEIQGKETLSPQNNSGKITIALGADHGGFAKKEVIKNFLSESNYNVIDCGTNSTDSVDYPDFAIKVAHQVSSGECSHGIMLDGAGIGSCMAINKVKGCRAALCYNEKTIANSKVHNNANVLTLGAPYHSDSEVITLVKLWLNTEFEGGRHQKRVDKIDALDYDKTCACKH